MADASCSKKNDIVQRIQEGESQSKFAHRVIEEMIITLDLPPGSRISEQSLSAELGIGRTPVREALQRLAYERTIRIQPRSGAVVSEIDFTEHFKLIELRREIERILVKRAARLADPISIRKFLDLTERFSRANAENDAALFISADGEFNALLAQTADNAYATAAMAPLQAQTRRLWYLHYREFGDVAKVSTLHADIAKAIANKNEEQARQASDALLDYVEDYTYQTITALKNTPPELWRGGKNR